MNKEIAKKNEAKIFSEKCKSKIIEISKKYGYKKPSSLIDATIMFHSFLGKKDVGNNLEKEFITKNKNEIKKFLAAHEVPSIRDLISSVVEAESCVNEFLSFREEGINNKTYIQDDELDSTKKKKRSNLKVFLILLISIAIVVVGIFLSGIYSANSKAINKAALEISTPAPSILNMDNKIEKEKKDASTKEKQDNNESKKQKIPKVKTVEKAKQIKIVKKIDKKRLSPDNSMVVVYPEMFTGKKISAGGVCKVVPSLYVKNREYVYYIKSKDKYFPIYKKTDWDKKGVKITKRVVTLSIDNVNKFVEIEKGKYLPLELFSSCSIFDD